MQSTSPPSRPIAAATTRRTFLRRGGAGAALLFGAGTLLAACGDDTDEEGAAGSAVAVSLPAGGNSLSIWKPIVETRKLSAPGVTFKWVGGDPGQLQTQFLAGTVDISTFGPLGAGTSLLKGDKVAIVGPGIYNHHKWIVADASPARTVADLRGKRIATGLNTSEAFRSVQLVVAMEGGDAGSDFEWVHGQGSAAIALFERGDVDAILVGEPNATILVAQGARQLQSVQEQWKAASGSEQPLFNAGPTVRLDWLEANPAKAGGAVKVLSEASTSLAADPAQLEAVATSIGVKPDQRDIARLLPERMADVYMPDFTDAHRRQLDDVVALGVKHGLLDRQPDAKPYADLPAA